MEEYKEAHGVMDSSLQISDRCLKLMCKTRDIGESVNDLLQDQGHQITDIEENNARIQDLTQQSSRKLRSIRSVFGTLANMVTPNKSVTKTKRSKKVPIATVVRDKPGRSSTMVTDDAELNHKIKKLDDNLDQLNDVLNDVHLEAVKINSQIVDHNQRLEGVTTHLDKNYRKVSKNLQQCQSVLQ